jgi:small subunit ribosomal protein S4
MIRSRKKFSRPGKPFDKARIEEENVLREKYGLKNKREIWKADAGVTRIRGLAKELITRSEEEKNAFVERLSKKGYKVETLQDALALNKEDLLKRRLQTILHTKGLALTPKQARQLITHRHVSVGDRIVNIPSYHITLEEEPTVKLNITLKIPEKKKSREEQIKEEIIEEEEKAEEELIA